MTIRTAFAQSLTSENVTQNYSYALLIPGSLIVQSGGYARLKFVGGTLPMHMQAAFVGRKGTGVGDFSAAPVAVTVGGLAAWAVGAGATVWSDPFPLTVEAGQPVIFRYDIADQAGQKYRLNSSLTGANLAYKAGNRGAGNADLLLGSGYSSLANWVGVVSGIQVADALEDFDAPPELPHAPSYLADLEQRAIGSTQFAAGGGYPGEPGKFICFTHSVLPGTGVYGFVDFVKITLSEESEVTLHSYGPPAGPDLELIQTGCNVFFAAIGPKSRIHKWSTVTNPALIPGRHTSYMVRAGGEILFSPRSFLGVVHPVVETGLTICVHKPGVGAHVSWDWHENPIT